MKKMVQISGTWGIQQIHINEKHKTINILATSMGVSGENEYVIRQC